VSWDLQPIGGIRYRSTKNRAGNLSLQFGPTCDGLMAYIARPAHLSEQLAPAADRELRRGALAKRRDRLLAQVRDEARSPSDQRPLCLAKLVLVLANLAADAARIVAAFAAARQDV
jgi:hypothetical protein